MKIVTVEDLNNHKEDYELIDVREDHERSAGNIGGRHIPMNQIPDKFSEIPKDQKVIIYCRSGNRSGNVVQYLESQGYDNVYNLEGGVLAWKSHIDENLNVV